MRERGKKKKKTNFKDSVRLVFGCSLFLFFLGDLQLDQSRKVEVLVVGKICLVLHARDGMFFFLGLMKFLDGKKN